MPDAREAAQMNEIADSSAADRRRPGCHSPLGQGAANVITGIFRGMPVGGSMSGASVLPASGQTAA